ncbi:MAG: RNA polymerase sigma factor [Candidatus Moraniibacteriota bacterium]
MLKEEKQTDADLVKMAKRDPELFGLLMERYQGQLFLYIRRLTGLGQDDVQDLLQEVFIKIYQKLNEYDEVLKFSSWIYRVAHNHIIDYFRKVNARPKSNSLEDYEWEKIISASVQIEKEIVDRDCAEKVKLGILQLPIKYREVLILRFLEEKEYEEIMDILKKPKGTIATLIARGKEILIKQLKAQNINCF